MGRVRIIKDLKIDAISLVYNPPHASWIIETLSPERRPMLETHKYVRVPIIVDEVQVTEANIEEVAKWVGGEVRTDTIGRYVKVKVHHPRSPRQTQAYIGDHVLYAGTGFKVYNDKAFKKSFEKVSDETTIVDPSKPKKRAAPTRKKIENDEIERVVEGDVVVPKRVAKKTA